jgi:hypothetical protein
MTCSVFKPDIIDLQSWLVESDNSDLKLIWETTKYLSSPYELWISVWKNSGCPDISTLAPKQ